MFLVELIASSFLDLISKQARPACRCKRVFVEDKRTTAYQLRFTKYQHFAGDNLTIVNLRNRTGEERGRQTLCDKRDNNFVSKNVPPNFTFLWTYLFVEEQKTPMLSEFPTKHASNSPVTFVTLERFAVLFFLPSCCVNSLIGSLSNVDGDGNENRNRFRWVKQQLCTCITLLCTFLCRQCTTATWKYLISRCFVLFSFLFLNFDTVF